MDRPSRLSRIDRFPDYWAGDDGQIYSWKTRHLRALVATPDRDGYLGVNLYDRTGRRTYVRVHALVCRAFHGPAAPGQTCVRHLNGVQTDNHADNLCWGTNRQNQEDRLRNLEAERMIHAGLVPADWTDEIARLGKRTETRDLANRVPF